MTFIAGMALQAIVGTTSHLPLASEVAAVQIVEEVREVASNPRLGDNINTHATENTTQVESKTVEARSQMGKNFKINDLIIHLLEYEAIVCPPKVTCFGTYIVEVGSLEKALGAQNPSVVAIQEVSAQIQGDPTQLQLQILEAKLMEALIAAESQLS
jgi:hypothetical protein